MTEAPDDDITAEARRIAAQVRQAAADALNAEELAQITAAALARRRADLTPGDIRHLAVTALTHAQQVSYLLGKLAVLLGDEDGEPGG